uniref:Uncharacterized protein n=1 Tax=viral metagenome TaxID=1070528 RepID=A0A6H1ZV03_9ZZZZ
MSKLSDAQRRALEYIKDNGLLVRDIGMDIGPTTVRALWEMGFISQPLCAGYLITPEGREALEEGK